jgi:hypothetical protein
MGRWSTGLVTVAPQPGESFLEVKWIGWYRRWWDARRPGWVDPGWWDMPIRPDVAPLLALPPGPELLAAASALRSDGCPADHGDGLPGLPAPGTRPGHPCGCQLVLAAAWQAITAWTSVRAAAVLADAAGQRPVVVPGDGAAPGITDPAREEVAAALRTSPRSAACLIAAARDLAAFPEAAALAADGALPLRAVHRVCAEAGKLDPGDAADTVAAWAGKVRKRAAGRRPMTAQGAVRAARRLILAAPSHARARARARADRRVELWNADDGTATLTAVLPEETALRIHRRLTAMARSLHDPADPRGTDAKRADLLADLLLGRATSQCSGVEVNVTVPLTTLLGLTDQPAEIPGLGPVPADIARALAADATWRAWLTGTDGAVVKTSPNTYRPTASLARLIRAREPACRMPGCTTPAQRCDLDHAVPWPQGPTTETNLGPLCQRHHTLKTHYGWNLIPETQIWRTPAGAQHHYAAA